MSAPESYVMPSFPMLVASDLAASARWYQDVLGFGHVFTIPPAGPPLLAHLRWVKYADLLLTAPRGPIAGPRGAGVTLYYQMEGTGRTVDQLAEAARAKGATIAAGPADQPWNAREVTVLDPDGYRLTFTQVIEHEGRDFEEVLRRARAGDLA